jgi:signal peptidase I
MKNEQISVKADIYDLVKCIVMALVATVLIFIFLARIIGVINISMIPTFNDGFKVPMSNLFYTPKQGDIVIFTKETCSNDPLVKRVIATEGQTVNIDFSSGKVWVDGVLLDETYINETMWRHFDVEFPVTVPSGCIFVMGDNRNVSLDSRSSLVGMVDTRCILGKVYGIVLPLGRLGPVD